MDLLIGIDAGTTRLKTLLVDLEGNVVASASQGYPTNRPHAGWVEQNPEDYWKALVTTVRDVMANLPAGSRQVLALSLSVQGGTSILADVNGNPLHPAICWMDQRCEALLTDLCQQLDPEEVYRASGWPCDGRFPLAHMLWMRRMESETFAATARWLQVSDFLMGRLCGVFCSDPSVAGMSLLYNIHTNNWNPQALAVAGIQSQQLPAVRLPGEVVAALAPQAAQQLGLSTKTRVVNGCHDQYAAALGAGAVQPGTVMLSSGTAWIVMAVTSQAFFGDPAAPLFVSRHPAPGRWGSLGSLSEVGSSVEWYIDQILGAWDGSLAREREMLYARLNQIVSEIPPGAEGLFCLPLSGGYRSALRKPGSVLWGLTLRHNKAHIGRALLEGIAFELRMTLESIAVGGIPIQSMKMVGGAAHSATWVQIISDVTGIPIEVSGGPEAASLGAAHLAAIGVGVLKGEDVWSAAWGANQTHLRQTFVPRQPERIAYDQLFTAYKACYTAYQSG